MDDRLVLCAGGRRIEGYRITGDPHTAETLFFYFPANRSVFQADISDYNQSAKRFVRFIEDRGIPVERVYGAHQSGFLTLQHMDNDEPPN